MLPREASALAVISGDGNRAPLPVAGWFGVLVSSENRTTTFRVRNENADNQIILTKVLNRPETVPHILRWPLLHRYEPPSNPHIDLPEA